MACPHKDVQYCPLYHASHMGNVRGCDDGHLDMGQCAVARGMNYADAVAAMSAIEPRRVAELRFSEEGQDRLSQQKRNMRAAGLH